MHLTLYYYYILSKLVNILIFKNQAILVIKINQKILKILLRASLNQKCFLHSVVNLNLHLSEKLILLRSIESKANYTIFQKFY